MQTYFIPSGRRMVRRRDTAILPIPPGVYPFMHARSRVRCDSDARSRASIFSYSVMIKRDPGLEPDCRSVLEARATILASGPFWRLATGVRKTLPGRGTCIEGQESVLRG